MKISSVGWLFVCYVQSENKFIVHVISVSSFYQAFKEHASLFPSHSVVFTLQVPVYLAEYLGKHLQSLFVDADCVYAEFARCISATTQSMIVNQVKTYQGLIPLSYSDASRRFALASWRGEYYEDAQAFVLHVSLVEFFNSIFFTSVNNVLNLFKNE